MCKNKTMTVEGVVYVVRSGCLLKQTKNITENIDSYCSLDGWEMVVSPCDMDISNMGGLVRDGFKIFTITVLTYFFFLYLGGKEN